MSRPHPSEFRPINLPWRPAPQGQFSSRRLLPARLLPAVLLCGGLLLAIQRPLQAQVDQVFGATGTPTNGAIVEITKEKVVIESSGNRRQFPIDQLQRVNFAQDPPELRRARDAIRGGQYEQAQNELAKIDQASVQREEIKTDIQFYIAATTGRLALAGSADLRTAGARLNQFLQSSADSYHYFEATELFGLVAEAIGRPDMAAPKYAELAQSSFPSLQMRGAMLEAGALLAAGKYPEALEGYRKVEQMGKGLTSPQAREQSLIATVGQAKCLAETGKQAEGQALIEAVIKDNDPQQMPAVFARAYNALGDCHRKADRTQDALLAYLHTELMFPNELSAKAEALYWLSKLWEKVQKSDRANRARSTLRSQFAGSIWAQKE